MPLTLETELTIEAPIDRVFAIFTDFADAADRISQIVSTEMLTDGPVGVGTKFRETRVVFGREHTETLEVTDFDPPASYTVGCTSCGTRYSTMFLFETRGDSTHVQFVMTCTPQALFAKLLMPLGRFMTKKMMRLIEQDMHELKAACLTPEN